MDELWEEATRVYKFHSWKKDFGLTLAKGIEMTHSAEGLSAFGAFVVLMLLPDVDGEDCRTGNTDDNPDKSFTPAARLVPAR